MLAPGRPLSARSAAAPAGSQRPASAPKRVSHRLPLFVALCLLLIVLAGAVQLTVGSVPVSFSDLWSSDDGPRRALAEFVLLELRLPRVLTGMLVGAALGCGGAVIQAITRNPLGSPSLMGVTSGAACAIIASYHWFNFGIISRFVFAAIGGGVAAGLTFTLAWRARLEPLALTLAGMSVGLFFMAAVTVLLLASDAGAGGLLYWLVGSLADRTGTQVRLLLPVVLPGLCLAWWFAPFLDALRFDDAINKAVGLNPFRGRLLFSVLVVVMTAACVAASGPIGFVGLVAPHLVRAALPGVAAVRRHRHLLLLSALCGMALVAVADTVALLLSVPVGIICALIGGPVLVLLIQRRVAASS